MSTQQPRNIELFNRITAITLVTLYESFPTPVDLDAGKIGVQAASDAESDKEEAFHIIGSLAKDSISFLVEEGFLRYILSNKTLNSLDFPDARLTLKGFTLLGKVPDSINESLDRRSFADHLKDALTDGTKGSVSELIKSMFIGAVQFGVTAVVNG